MRIMKSFFKVIFSRYFISALLILIEIALILFAVIYASAYSAIALVAMGIVNLLAFLSLVNKETTPEYKVSWMFVLLAVPLFGSVIYLMFYSRRLTRTEANLMRGIYSRLERDLELATEKVSSLSSCGVEDGTRVAKCAINSPFGMDDEDGLADPLALGKIKAIMNDDILAEPYKRTSLDYFSTGEAMFSAMIEDISRAERFVFLEYFIIDRGEMLDTLIDSLAAAARRGVEVRLLFDDFGCMRTLPEDFPKQLSALGITAMRFSPIAPKAAAEHNNRDHRKICIVDGVKAFTGGINIADEYINKKERFGHWKDGGVRVFGDAARGFVKLFLSLWDFTSGKVSDPKPYLVSSGSISSDGGIYVPFGSGPAPIYQRSVGKNAFLNIINQSRDYVYITTPYLVIDYDLTEALCNAALRGVDVRIVTPGIADKKLVKIMTKSAYSHLMSSGVRIYEYVPGFMHEKLVISDGEYAIVGTINFDFRSLAHHFEDAVWMFRAPAIGDIKEEYMRVLSVSELCGKGRATLSFGERILAAAIRIFAPLL